MLSFVKRPAGPGLRADSEQVAVPLHAGQRVDGRQRRGERRLVFRTDPGQDHGEPLGSHRPAAGQHLPARLGQPDLDHPPVGGVRVPADQPGILQPGDQLRHGRLGYPFLGGERGEPSRARPLQGGQRRGRGQRQSVRRAQRPEQPDQPLQPRRDPGRQRPLRPETAPRPAPEPGSPSFRPPEISISYLYHILMYIAIRRVYLIGLEASRAGQRVTRKVGEPASCWRTRAGDVDDALRQMRGGGPGEARASRRAFKESRACFLVTSKVASRVRRMPRAARKCARLMALAKRCANSREAGHPPRAAERCRPGSCPDLGGQFERSPRSSLYPSEVNSGPAV